MYTWWEIRFFCSPNTNTERWSVACCTEALHIGGTTREVKAVVELGGDDLVKPSVCTTSSWRALALSILGGVNTNPGVSHHLEVD